MGAGFIGIGAHRTFHPVSYAGVTVLARTSLFWCLWGCDLALAWSLPAVITFALDDDLIGVVGEPVQGALGEDRVIEEGDPLLDAAS